jgi:hypothetical protein
MRVLLDECVDRRLAQDLLGHDVETVSGLGWAGLKNGELLARAEKVFQAFITVDRNLSFQQPISKCKLGVVLLKARTNRLVDLRPMLPQLLATLEKIKEGEIVEIGT